MYYISDCYSLNDRDFNGIISFLFPNVLSITGLKDVPLRGFAAVFGGFLLQVKCHFLVFVQSELHKNLHKSSLSKNQFPSFG